ncbi:NF-kappa-B inhibitor cactus-like [Oratosquilla oratoria]|uniref:NF-kappa-B inhibitor cactus-like n=1 Tax=Oratosquilla oratoria TaxID=337810 RepID=UPI003F75F810
MWQVAPGRGEGGFVEECNTQYSTSHHTSPVAPPGISHMTSRHPLLVEQSLTSQSSSSTIIHQGRTEGSISPESELKSVFDSHNDSGFLSGSNLVSSSSVSEDLTTLSSSSLPSSPMRCESSKQQGGRGREGEGTHPTSSPSSSSKDPQRSFNRLDSGIDISDQLSTLNIASPSPVSTSHITSSDSAISSTSSRFDGAQDSCRSSTGEKGSTQDGGGGGGGGVSVSGGGAACPPRRSRLGLDAAQVALLQEVFQRDEDGDTQLHVAVMRGFVEVVYHITRLLPHQAFLDLPNHSGRTALHVAVCAGNVGLARHLIVCGASPVARDHRGNTPLHSACVLGDDSLVDQLTQPVLVAEVMHARLRYAPAHTAGLLAADLSNYEGQTCIHTSAQGGHKSILQHLTWYGADINAKEGKSGRTALHYAVERRDAELTAFLTQACRASLNVRTYAGLTPYQLAMSNGAVGIAKLLLDLGAPRDPLPIDDDLDSDEPSDMEGYGLLNGWSMEDLRIGGVPVTMATPVPVTNSSPINADFFI